jgi:phosphotransferase system HPr (HPr) family protein
MIKHSVKIINKLGLHTRAAAQLMNLASKFSSQIQIQFQDNVADCKSIMNLITLGATHGASLELMVKGEDEEAASAAVEKLFLNRFGEPE